MHYIQHTTMIIVRWSHFSQQVTIIQVKLHYNTWHMHGSCIIIRNPMCSAIDLHIKFNIIHVSERSGPGIQGHFHGCQLFRFGRDSPGIQPPAPMVSRSWFNAIWVSYVWAWVWSQTRECCYTALLIMIFTVSSQIFLLFPTYT